MKRTATTLLAALAFTVGVTAAQAPRTPAKTLDIYVIDAEGGQAMLFVSPTGESLLMDSGNPGARDHERIMEVIKAAGLTRLDYLLTTHYHVDHIGGMQALAAAIPIGHYIDHGPSVEEREQVAGFQAVYAELKAKAKHTVVKPGDRLPIAGLDWRIVTSAGQVLKTPLPGGGQPNAACAGFQPKEITNDPENAQSVGSVISYGQFKTIQLGDLLWNKEFELMCPNTPIGPVDVYLASHHGTDSSGSEALVHGLRPRVAVMENGTRKGGTLLSMTTLRSSQGLEDIWLSHWSHNVLLEHNPAGVFIANVEDAATAATLLTAPPRGGGPGGRRGGGPGGPGAPGAAGPAGPGGAMTTAPQAAAPGAAPAAGAPAAPAPQAGSPAAGPQAAPGQGAGRAGAPGAGRAGGRGGGVPPHTPAHWIKISAQTDGTFTVTNSRNNFSKTYVKR